MKKLITSLFLLLVSISARAQFSPGQILTAAALNGQFALYAPLGGATFTGAVTIPTLTVTGTTAFGAIQTSNATITGGAISGITPLPLASGGTGAATASGARTNLSAAASGANSDITSLTGLTTPLSVAQGGTGTNTGTGTGSVVLSQAPQLTATGGYINQIGPYTGTWVNSVYSGVFEYLEANSAFNARGKPDAIGVFAATRTSSGSGGSSAANIGVSSMAYNDYVGGSAGAWGFYATVARASGNTGVTHGMEMDVANMGSLVQIQPYNVNLAGLTEGLRLATGGEIATNNVVGTASAALTIVRNDANATPHALFDKGIVFDANAISSTGYAIALPVATGGNTIQWFTPTGTDGGYINSNVTTAANATHLNFSNTGAAITGSAGQQLLNVPSVANAVNYLTVNAAATGSGVTLNAVGSDPNVGITLAPKGAQQVYVDGAFQVAGAVNGPFNVTGSISATNGVVLPVATVASLPACNSGSKGMMYAVSDATAPTYNAALTGGGAVSVPVYCNGSAWTSH